MDLETLEESPEVWVIRRPVVIPEWWGTVQTHPRFIVAEALPPPATQEREHCVVVGSNETQEPTPGVGANPLGTREKRRPGRKRFKVRSMYGRFPWTACVNDLEAQATGFAE